MYMQKDENVKKETFKTIEVPSNGSKIVCAVDNSGNTDVDTASGYSRFSRTLAQLSR
jgi:hypothetical protein